MNLDKLFQLQFMMFAEMCAGYLLCGFHILKPSDRSVLSKAVINLFLPANIINAFSLELNNEILEDFVQILLVSSFIQILCMVLAHVLYNRTDPEKKKILQYSTVCSNAGFLGNAVAEGVYGQLGMLYGQIYLIPLRIVMFSAGVSYFQGSSDFKTAVRKIMTHPCIIALIIGLFRMGLNVSLPEAVTATLSSLGRCSTPLIMVFLGMILAEYGFSTMLSRTNLLFALVRLVLLPAAVLAVCLFFHIEPMITGLSVLLCAMPAGTTSAVFAEQYHSDVRFAADVVVLSTILSIAVLPLWAWLLSTL